MTWFFATRVGRALSAALAALIAILGARAYWKREGAQDATDEAERLDHERADDIRRRAADADGVHDVDDIYRD